MKGQMRERGSCEVGAAALLCRLAQPTPDTCYQGRTGQPIFKEMYVSSHPTWGIELQFSFLNAGRGHSAVPTPAGALTGIQQAPGV